MTSGGTRSEAGHEPKKRKDALIARPFLENSKLTSYLIGALQKSNRMF